MHVWKTLFPSHFFFTLTKISHFQFELCSSVILLIESHSVSTFEANIASNIIPTSFKWLFMIVFDILLRFFFVSLEGLVVRKPCCYIIINFKLRKQYLLNTNFWTSVVVAFELYNFKGSFVCRSMYWTI
jgi:hypothetical protein